MVFSVKLIEENELIVLSKEDAKELNLLNSKVTVARFGYKISDIHVKIDEDLPPNKVYLSKNVTKILNLPLSNTMLIKVENKEIVFGPYIGIYLGSGKLNIGWKYERLKSFVMQFNEEIHGAMIAFTEKDINYSNMTINAYCYNASDDLWRKEKVPFPTAIHRYGDMNKTVRKKLRAIYGNNLFNYDEMDKRDELSALLLNKDTAKYIPDTIFCENVDQFKEFVSKYDDVYFKPIKGRKGRGIHRIKKERNQFTLILQYKKKFEEKNFNDLETLVEFLHDKIVSKEYLLQKTIQLTMDGRVIDFRIRFEKDINNKWKQSIFAARVSGLGGVVSNRSAGGEVITPFEALTKYYKFTPEEAEKHQSRLIEAGYLITQAVERAHLNYGKCAVDLGLEKDGTIYHIESNVKAPNDLTTRSFEKFDGLDRICTLNSMYSKRLAGFKDVHTKVLFENKHGELYSEENLTYHVILGSSSRSDELLNDIKSIFSEHQLTLENEIKRNFHIEFEVFTNEINLVNVFKKVRKIDENGAIRTILYRPLKRVRKRKSKVCELERKIAQLENEIRKMETSTSWKVSKPIRLIGKMFKK